MDTHATAKDTKLAKIEKFWRVRTSSKDPLPRCFIINPKVGGNARILWKRNWKELSKAASIIKDKFIQSE